MKKLKMFALSIVAMLFMVNFVNAETIEVDTAEELKTALINGDNVKLTGDFEVSEKIRFEEKNVTLDLNGYTITGKDNYESGNFIMFENFKGEFTIIDSSNGKGMITLTAEHERNWNAMSTIVEARKGIVNIDGAVLKHLGGTAMAYVINVNSNSFGSSTLNVTSGTIESSYTGVRLYMDTVGATYVNVSGGTVNGTKRAIWAQAPSTKEGHLGEINITGGNVGFIQTATGSYTEVKTEISGGTVNGVMCEKTDLKITGGNITGPLTIVDENGDAVEKDEIITAGSFSEDVNSYTVTGYVSKLVNGNYVVAVENKVNVATVTNGTVTVDKTKAIAGETVTITVTPSEGYELATLKVVDADKKEVTITNNTFVMPNGEVTVTATLTETETTVSLPVVDTEIEVEEVVVGVKKTEKTEEVLLESLTEMLKDEEQKELAEVLTNSSAVVEVEILPEQAETLKPLLVEEIEKTAGKAKIATYFDISVVVKNASNGDHLVVVPELTKEIELVVLLPEELKNTDKKVNRTYYVIRHHENTVEKLPATLSEDGKSLVFKSNKFSTYALAYEDAAVVDTKVPATPATYDGINMYLVLGTISLVALLGASLYIKKRNFN